MLKKETGPRSREITCKLQEHEKNNQQCHPLETFPFPLESQQQIYALQFVISIILEEENKIMQQNNILLTKMMDIQRLHLRSSSSGSLPLSLSHVSNQNQRKFEKHKINQENQKFLYRLQSASSIYNKNYWQPDSEKNQIYKQIILKRTKLNQDYNDLARKSLESRSSGRMLSSAQQFQRRPPPDDQFPSPLPE